MATAAISSAAVRLRGFGKSYKRRLAVENVGFEVSPGMLYGLLGPDGAGKSSILKAIAGVLTYDAGTLEVFDTTIDSERAGEAVKDRLGFMPQGLGLNLYPELSVDENIDFFADLRLVPKERYASRKEELLTITRLAEGRDRRMRQLSGGMKQKLGLICALIHDPKLLILDEPTTGVDPVSRRDFWTILSREVHQRGITAIVSTAYMDEASRFDRISVLHEGRMLAEGTPDEVIGKLPGTVISVASSAQAQALTLLRETFPQADAMGDRIRIRVDAEPREAIERVRGAVASVPFEDLKVEEPALEDTFVYLLSLDGRHFEPPPSEDDAPIATKDGDAVTAESLTHAYDGFVAADHVSFRVRQGEIFGLLGANGAGKTTVIKMLTGIVPATSGQGQVAGVEIGRAGNEVKRRIGYVSQAFSLYQDLTVRENILLYAGIYGLDRARSRKRLEWILDFGGLREFKTSRSGDLPLGLRQRLALGCALVHQPRVLFLDEPTSGVDPLGRRTIWDLLFRLSREQGVAILVTTHYMSEAEHCDQLALMHAGRVVADASPGELRRSLTEEAGQLFELTEPDLDGTMSKLRASGFEPTAHGRKIHLFSKQPDADGRKVLDLLPNAELRPVELTMEDVFVYRMTQLEAGRGA